jgi:hypothetical protein
MSDVEEIWRDISGYDGDYKVSNWGRVKSYKYDKVNGMIRKEYEKKNKDGYVRLCVDLYNKEGKKKEVIISRLVAMAFIPNPLNLPEVDHRDGNPLNNHVSNLKWAPREINNRNKKGFGNTKILGLHYYEEQKGRSPRIRAYYRNKKGKLISKSFTINPDPYFKNAKEGERGYCYPSREAAEAAGKKWLKETRDVEFPDVYIQCYLRDN